MSILIIAMSQPITTYNEVCLDGDCGLEAGSGLTPAGSPMASAFGG
ncbi:hypothetical protein [Phyllobacterium endophyticum]|nr:hypothetical protein [Phyllobacterium endophyticum]MBB3236774.1 hypothetical protein [Phyllobacterium endophyticum]